MLKTTWEFLQYNIFSSTNNSGRVLTGRKATTKKRKSIYARIGVAVCTRRHGTYHRSS